MRAVQRIPAHGAEACGETRNGGAGQELRSAETGRILRRGAALGNVAGWRLENNAIVVVSEERSIGGVVDHAEGQSAAQEPVARQRPASKYLIRTPLESGVAEHIGQHKIRAQVVADIVICASVVAPEVVGVLRLLEADVGGIVGVIR